VGIVLVKFGFGVAIGYAVEIAEEVELLGFVFGFLTGFRLLHQVIDKHLGVDLFLDVEGRGADEEVLFQLHVLFAGFGVLGVFAPPDELGVEVAVTSFVGDLDGALGALVYDGLHLGGRDVFAGGVVMG
jgi:hypothetical protein